MNSNRFLASDLFMDNHCLLGVYMREGKEMAWLVSSNRNYSQIERTISFPYFLEDLTIGCITRIEYLLALRSLDNKASPKSCILLEESSLGPMANREKGNLEFIPID